MLRTTAKCAVLICTAVFLLALIPGCKKNNTSGPSLVGTWRNIDTAGNMFRYLVLRSDQSAYKLSSSVYNLHLKDGVAYAIENDKITLPLSTSSATVYSFTLSNDTLYLNSPAGNVRFKKDADQNPDTWVKDILINNYTSAGNGFWFGPMDYAAGKYITSGIYLKKLYSIDGSNTLQIDSTSLLGSSIPAVATLGTDIWISTPSVDYSIRKVDFATSTVTTVSAAAPAKVISMAKHNNKLIVLTTTGTFYDYNPVADNFTQIVAMPDFFGSGGPPTGFLDMEYKDNKLYLLYFNLLLELDLSSGQFAQTYQITSSTFGLSLAGSSLGLCYDGSSFVTQKVTQGSSAYDIHVDIAKFNLP